MSQDLLENLPHMPQAYVAWFNWGKKKNLEGVSLALAAREAEWRAWEVVFLRKTVGTLSQVGASWWIVACRQWGTRVLS